MESRIEAAAERHARAAGPRAQAVACTYADKVGMDETTPSRPARGLFAWGA